MLFHITITPAIQTIKKLQSGNYKRPFSLEDILLPLKRYLILVKLFQGNFFFNYVTANLKYMKNTLGMKKSTGNVVSKLFINFKTQYKNQGKGI